MKRYTTLLVALVFIGFVTLGVSNITKTRHKVQLKTIELQDSSAKLKTLQLKYETLNKNLDVELQSKNQDQDKIKQLEQERNDLQKKKQDLEGQLQAKLQRQENDRLAAQRASQSLTKALTGTSTVSALGNDYKAFIYAHESGNNPTATNSIGCYGLGQDCNGIVRNKCGANYYCQDQFFEDYASRRYGGWLGAYTFWLQNRWW